MGIFTLLSSIVATLMRRYSPEFLGTQFLANKQALGFNLLMQAFAVELITDYNEKAVDNATLSLPLPHPTSKKERDWNTYQRDIEVSFTIRQTITYTAKNAGSLEEVSKTFRQLYIIDLIVTYIDGYILCLN